METLDFFKKADAENLHGDSTFNAKDLIFLLLIGVAYFLMQSQYIQVHEDLSYCFNSADGTPIRSFEDAIVSQAHDYMHSVARFSVHVFVQYFCSLTNKTVFFAISAVLFVVLNAGLLFIVRYEFGRRKTDKYIILFWLFMMMPLVGTTFFGHIAFVVNYLWSSALNVLFVALFMYWRRRRISSIWFLPVLLLSGFIGGLQESFSVCIIGALFLYCIYKRKEISSTGKIMIVGYLIGTLTLVFAPGNISRAFATKSASEQSWLMAIVYNFGRVIFGYWPILVCAVVSLIMFFLKRIPFIAFFRKNACYFLSLFIIVLFTAFVAYTARHQLTCASVILLIITMKVLYSWLTLTSRQSTIINLCIVLLLTSTYSAAFARRSQQKEVYKTFVESVKYARNTVATANDFIHFDKVVMENSPLRDYLNISHVTSQVYYKNGIENLSRYITNGRNAYLKTVVLPDTPSRVLRNCTKENEISDGVFALTDYMFIVKCPKGADVNDVTIVVEQHPTSLKSKLLDFVKNNRTVKLKAKDIDMSFTYKNERYFFLVWDRENNGYKTTSMYTVCK